MASWKDVVVSPQITLGDAISKVDKSGLQAALVVSADGRLLGILTDGDIRRAILAGQGMQGPVSESMTAQPTTVDPSLTHAEMLVIMRHDAIHHLPLVGEDRRVVGLVTLDDLINKSDHPNWVVLMAGGLGTRLKPLTDGFPKPLLEVGGKPILETILQSFAEQGFKRILLSVYYEAQKIRDYFGNGDRWGVQIEYLEESTPLGTAGALALLPEKPTVPFIVMNGDVLTRINFDALLRYHISSEAIATMAVRQVDFQVPYGVVRLDGSRIEAIEEKPLHSFLVNSGVYALSPDALDHLPPESTFDIPTMFQHLIAVGKTTNAFPLHEYWMDVGGVEEFERAQREWVEPKH